MSMEKILEIIPSVTAEYVLNLIAALLIFFIGRWVAGRVTSMLESFLTRQKLEPMLTKFVVNLIYYALWTFVLLAALGRLGIQTTSFIAVLGAAGLAVGLALQGSLSNFAAGVLIILFRPFKFGDFIEAAGVAGTISDIQIFNTVLSSPDNVKIIVPNAQILAGCVKNYSALPTRRIEIKVGVSYKDDLKKVRHVLQGLADADTRILKEPVCLIAVKEMGESSVDFIIRPWVKSPDYWNVFFDLTERIKVAFDENNITIPFPQREMRVIHERPASEF